MDRHYSPLRLRRISGPLGYFRPTQELPARVALETPAIMTMTDLRQVAALTVEPDISIDWALARMREGGVRLLLVTNHEDDIIGIITATDILGEKPLQLLQDARLTRAEIRVRDIMVPRSDMEFIAMEDALKAAVGDVLETLRRAGRHHALVYDCDDRTGMLAVRGIFSASRLSHQLGINFEPMEVASTFAEKTAAIGRG